MRAFHRVLAPAALLLLVVPACTVKKADNPASSGPSELSLSLFLTATPDLLPQDGASQSQVVVLARDGNARPVPNLSIRADIVVGGALQDFGTLSARTLVTGGDGRAVVTYTAPDAVFGVVGELVTIRVVPIGTDSTAAIPRTVSIQLVAPGGIAPNAPGVPDFTMTPEDPIQLDSVVFDASDPDLDGELVRYQWNFGDGSTAQGRIVQHAYSKVGSFVVTLTVTDRRGGVASRTKSIAVGAGQAPTATFVFSPTEPAAGQTVFFNGSQSTAAPGRSLVKYEWHFGTGGGTVQATGAVVSRTFPAAGTYNVTLKVTDNVGVTGSASQTVTVTP